MNASVFSAIACASTNCHVSDSTIGQVTLVIGLGIFFFFPIVQFLQSKTKNKSLVSTKGAITITRALGSFLIIEGLVYLYFL